MIGLFSRSASQSPRVRKAQQKRSVPRPRIELGTHGSSGHVLSETRNQARTRTRYNMVLAHDKWFNESGEQALRLDTRGRAATRIECDSDRCAWASDLQIDADVARHRVPIPCVASATHSRFTWPQALTPAAPGVLADRPVPALPASPMRRGPTKRRPTRGRTSPRPRPKPTREPGRYRRRSTDA
jgi:hypothetical protein